MRLFLTLLFLGGCLLVPDICVGNITNRVLMVDQEGRLNLPEVLATQAQLSTNAAAVAIAEAKAEAAASAAAEGTNLVAQIVDQIAANELTVYRQGFIDSITSDVSLPPDTKCMVLKILPAQGMAGGKVRHVLTYATTRAADNVVPDVLFSDTIAGGRDAMQPLPADQVGAVRRTDQTLTAPGGTVYPYVYEVDIFTAPSASGFFIVYLSGDASADGSVFEISGGIAGGASVSVPFGSKTLVFKGGLLVGVLEGGAQ